MVRAKKLGKTRIQGTMANSWARRSLQKRVNYNGKFETKTGAKPGWVLHSRLENLNLTLLLFLMFSKIIGKIFTTDTSD